MDEIKIDLATYEDIAISDLRFPRAKEFVRAASYDSEIYNVTGAKRHGNTEYLFLTIAVDKPQYPVIDIREYEDIAIVFDEIETNFPIVHALRPDFPQGIPHTNIRMRPVWLCITEDSFDEVKHRFTASQFLYQIREWFNLTAKGKLHKDDQELEPFLSTSKSVVVSKESLQEEITSFGLKPYNDYSGKHLFKLVSDKEAKTKYVSLRIIADPVVHGDINWDFSSLLNLDSSLKYNNGCTLFSLLSNILCNQDIASDGDSYSDVTILFLCDIPLKRSNASIAEKVDTFFVNTVETLRDLAVKSGLWTKGNSGYIVNPITPAIKNYILERPIQLLSCMEDFSHSFAAQCNGAIEDTCLHTLIGAGALGSQVLNLLCRTGFGKWIVIDDDTLCPHNLARHELNRACIGFNKALSVAFDMNNLLGDNSLCKPICKKISEETVSDSEILEAFANSKAIIDISTSIAVERILASDVDKRIKTRRISAFLNPSGKCLIILAEDTARVHKLDLLEMEYYRMINETPELHNHLFLKKDSKIRYRRNSCRELSVKINNADVAQCAAIAAKVLPSIIHSQEASISLWQIDDESCTTKFYHKAPSSWTRFSTNGYSVYICDRLINEIQAERSKYLPNETGGVLIGSIDIPRKKIYIFDSIYAENSVNEREYFIRGDKTVLKQYKEYREVTDGQICYVGEWHSHPDRCPTKPSSLDMKLLVHLTEHMAPDGLPVVMIITGKKKLTVICGIAQ